MRIYILLIHKVIQIFRFRFTCLSLCLAYNNIRFYSLTTLFTIPSIMATVSVVTSSIYAGGLMARADADVLSINVTTH